MSIYYDQDQAAFERATQDYENQEPMWHYDDDEEENDEDDAEWTEDDEPGDE